MKILILAAGMGKRMNSKVPKVMHKILEKPILTWVVEKSLNLTAEVAVVLGHGIEQIKNIIPENVEIFEQKEQLGTAHAVMSAKNFLTGDNLLITYGDVPLISEKTLSDLIKMHEFEKNDATLITVDMENPFGYGRIVRINDKFNKIVEHKDASENELKINEINSGIAIFKTDKLVESLKKIKPNNAQKEYYLTDSFNFMDKVGILKIANQIEISGVNDRIQLSQLEKAARNIKLNELMLEGVTITDPESTYISYDTRIGRDTIIYPQTFIYGKNIIGEDCIIGPMTRIENCEVGNNSKIIHSECEKAVIKSNVSVGPFTRLREKAVLEENSKVGNFVEIKKTTLGKGSKASHLSYLGDAEIGEKVNIGAGTITCNYDGKNKFKTKIENNVFIGSNSSLVAPVTIEENATIGAGSVITKNVEKNSLALGRARQITKNNWKKEK